MSSNRFIDTIETEVAGEALKRISRPFFSIVIPTMNRPTFFEAAFKSALQQKTSNFELIISDNSSDASALNRNEKTVRAHSDECQVHYYRPPSWLNMPDHWEFATRKANGRYVFVLPDRFVMCPSTLNYIYQVINKLDFEVDLLSWDSSSHYDSSGVIQRNSSTGTTKVRMSNDAISEFMRIDERHISPIWNTQIPRTLNSCYSRKIATKIRSRYERLFHPSYPDYTSGFLLLFNTKSFIHCDLPMYISHGSESNGRKALIHGLSGYMDTLNNSGNKLFQPINLPSSLPTVTNSILTDFLNIHSLVSGTEKSIHTTPVELLILNYCELIRMESAGTQVGIDLFYQKWEEETKKISPKTQLLVKQHIKNFGINRPKFARLRRWVVRMRLDNCYYHWLALLNAMRYRISRKVLHQNVFDASRDMDLLILNAIHELATLKLNTSVENRAN